MTDTDPDTLADGLADGLAEGLADGAVDRTDGQEILRFASVDNFRDVAGPGRDGRGYPTLDGATVRRGVFYRSNDLRLSEDEHGPFTALGLTTIIDLRADEEIAAHPDPEVPGATNLHFDAIGIPMAEVSRLPSREAAVELMERVYRLFVTEQKCRTAFGGVLRQLADGGPQLFHCSAGKDRTGWVGALLLHIAGVDDPTIESDYLLTNAMSAASRARTEKEIASHLGQDAVAVFEPVLVADTRYLRAAYDAVGSDYGDRASYLRDGLGLDDEVIERLRSHLREL